jgi:hypothetical protein
MRCFYTLQPWRDVGPEIIGSGFARRRGEGINGRRREFRMPNYPFSAVFINGVFCRLCPIKPSGKKRIFRYAECS